MMRSEVGEGHKLIEKWWQSKVSSSNIDKIHFIWIEGMREKGDNVKEPFFRVEE